MSATCPVGLDGCFDPEQLRVSPAQQVAIAALPQGSQAWREARWWRLTASNAGAAAGHGLPGARERVLQAMLWPETCTGAVEGYGARFAAYGTAHEPVARELYIGARVARDADAFVALWETGLLVSTEHG